MACHNSNTFACHQPPANRSHQSLCHGLTPRPFSASFPCLFASLAKNQYYPLPYLRRHCRRPCLLVQAPRPPHYSLFHHSHTFFHISKKQKRYNQLLKTHRSLVRRLPYRLNSNPSLLRHLPSWRYRQPYRIFPFR